MTFHHALSFVTAASILLSPALAEAYAVNPTSDGYVCGGVGCTIDFLSVVVAGNDTQGVVKFASAEISGPTSQVLLTLNPYGFPVTGTKVAIYGYGTSIGTLVGTDWNAGTYLGTLILPDGLGVVQPDAIFDVTSFVQTTNAPFLAFNLRTDSGTDVFSSLEYNYGHPSQLLVTASVPEPATQGLLACGLALIAGLRSVRSSRMRSVQSLKVHG